MLDLIDVGVERLPQGAEPLAAGDQRGVLPAGGTAEPGHLGRSALLLKLAVRRVHDDGGGRFADLVIDPIVGGGGALQPAHAVRAGNRPEASQEIEERHPQLLPALREHPLQRVEAHRAMIRPGGSRGQKRARPSPGVARS